MMIRINLFLKRVEHEKKKKKNSGDISLRIKDKKVMNLLLIFFVQKPKGANFESFD